MAAIKYYPEDELVHKIQEGEFGWIDYVNHHSLEWQEEFTQYCLDNHFTINEESAQAFVDFKGTLLEESMNN